MKPRIFAGLPEEERERMKAEKAKADAQRAEQLRKAELYYEVITAVTHVFKTDPRKKGRKGTLVNARASAYLILSDGGLGPSEIGRLFGLTHGTVIHARDKAKDWLLYDPKFRQLHEKVLTLVNEKTGGV